jgi:hypothetical protein
MMRLPARVMTELGASGALAVAVCMAIGVAACAPSPADPVPFKDVSADRIIRPGYTQPGEGKVAVDVRRERSDDVVVRFRSAQVYVDGEQVTNLMNGEHVVFYLSPGVHRIAVSTQFDPVIELQFVVTADPRYSNRASVAFNHEHRVMLRRVAK